MWARNETKGSLLLYTICLSWCKMRLWKLRDLQSTATAIYLLLSQGWGERHSALYSELKKCSHGNSFMELLYSGPDFDYRGFVYVCLWALKSTGFFFLPKICVTVKLFLNSKFLNMYCEGPLVGEMGTGRNPTFGYHYLQILKYSQSLALNEENFLQDTTTYIWISYCLILLVPNSGLPMT